MQQSWFVARTHHQREAWASENIVRQLAVPYLPRIAEKVKTPRGTEVRPRFLFPSYIFVKCLDGRWRFLLSTYGVASVVMGAGGTPATVRDDVIMALRAMEDVDGLVQLPKPFKSGLTPKQAVRVTDGLYTGYEGIYEGLGPKERSRVLLNYLGHKTTVLLPTEHLSGV